MADNSWEPTAKQSEFLSLPFSVLEGFYAGAVGAGKSDVLLVYPLIHRLHENPDFKGLFMRRTFPELKNEIIPRSRRFFTKVGGTYNKNDKVWEFPSGALFFFGHCENEDDVHNYDSMQPNYVAFDELTSFTEWQYLYITLQRVRTKRGSELPAIVRSASNPGNIGHNWVRKRFIDPCVEGHRLIKAPSGILRIFIPATIDDNPHIDPAYRKSLEALPLAEKQAKLYGDWSAYEGQVFEEFRDKQYPDEPTNALHVIDSFPIEDWWPRINVTDWGFAALTYSLWGAISPEGRLFIYREQFWRRTKIEEWAPYVKEFIDLDKPRKVILCKSAGQDRGQEHTIQSQVSSALDTQVDLAINNPGSRVAGKTLLHEYFRWKPKYVPQQDIKVYSEERAQWLFRNRGLSEYKSYLDSFNPPEIETNLPKIQIFSDCKLLINTIKTCVYAKAVGNTAAEDVAQFDGDDPYDTLRMMVDSADRFADEASLEFTKMKQQAEMLNRLKQDNDWTAFYRNARIAESENKSISIRRYRH